MTIHPQESIYSKTSRARTSQNFNFHKDKKMGQELHNTKTADRKKFLKIRGRINFCRRWFEENGNRKKSGKSKEVEKLISKYRVLNFYRMQAFLKKHPEFSGFFPSAKWRKRKSHRRNARRYSSDSSTPTLNPTGPRRARIIRRSMLRGLLCLSLNRWRCFVVFYGGKLRSCMDTG